MSRTKKLLSLLAFLVLSFRTQCVRSLNPSLNDDVLGLIVFKADLQDPKRKLSSWNQDDDTPCNWLVSNGVTELSLDGLSLSGQIGRGLMQLQFLHKLSLSRNCLTGSINPNLTRLENLRIIDLSENSLSGQYRRTFLRIGDSKYFELILASINLSSNQFSGSLPAGIWGLNGLSSLDLSGNLLDSEIPRGIEVLNNLRNINLSKNRFNGGVPNGIGSCLLLRSVDFSENMLSGTVPDTMQNLGLCNYLSLSNNSVRGEVPNWIGELNRLETLDLSGNRFSGSNFNWNLQSLKVFNLSANSLSVELTRIYDQLWETFWLWILARICSVATFLCGFLVQEIRLERNSLSGQIPSSIGNCSSLTTFLTRSCFSVSFDEVESYLKTASQARYPSSWQPFPALLL
ncbi:LOW QUALITY PROTEIN: hypothetical protein NC653_031229 [Populus alba x Populus x berolinensis]|uniref:Leucine-rich repeat-containing N-terminal plant-type domain-containing protein n=1 Tax=Populus alba x Populus x berolinensis TaxID=444605 RepID=A0AAD6LXU2_9ROSI|nr:LOW QUALITY PROTEIN: hypothetical protein NC653_031229 [Populus alba x Populus x berolinensis]